ncbi:hypothetical protein ARMGADRAFT_484334 [Armillaria gallica]|uniref:Uncharacterized protein n=1 Tax=Armillaria gallica TaxID=47427 RepID=A0A2H3ECA4_ARMGA|nr:hypothetical protein ARMGADRAFT_484334 [Armillaria gallica]
MMNHSRTSPNLHFPFFSPCRGGPQISSICCHSCKNALRPLIPAHSLPIPSAALRWKYRLLVDEAAKHAIALSADEVVRPLDAAYLAPWLSRLADNRYLRAPDLMLPVDDHPLRGDAAPWPYLVAGRHERLGRRQTYGQSL